ncbi:hypothetical protein, conserved [Trypanosoma brucei gambiense DAL972]|uniref:RanBP2-type domain-containing protein n=3 Tax=Trypanosoma brucei TaxID=5691 RepID=C9ZJT7_TRYB9|nr:hypothetical protein, conserved [Trypanosoma brucei gambiense DAL972]RHW74058.1 mitochondrial RNA binding complex 1 subunit [Trypanosoma brucei equiperdum]CAB60087.1 hypothetical protein [Trypanosoma brucei]CBH09647.1 hypothetical protein, conserved [Trypanosoma brucei gambiense DAL972]|eukprot:XP_011771951.1 hypothetical protein, conserved [Trypanosoma brucei gambiense DAL972]
MFSGLQRALTVVGSPLRYCRRFHHVTAVRFFARVSGDWSCPCGFSNFASRSVCFQCHRQKPVFLRAAGETYETDIGVARFANYKRGDWVCTCGSHNFARRETCMLCCAPCPSGGGKAEAKRARLLPGDWICPKCTTHNFRGRKECMLCSAGVPVGVENATNLSNETTSDLKGKENSEESQQPPWTCVACHTVNVKADKLCEVCGASRTESSRSTHSSVTRPDDWTCTECSFLNFSSRVKCKNCKALRSSGEVETSEAMWICNCGYKNFKDRSSCRECGASKESDS